MKIVARRTGLSPHLIRIWERRYGAVCPVRSDSNRRLYRDAEISRLLMLRQATRAGHSIGRIAKLSVEDLRGLLNGDRVPNGVERDSRGGRRASRTDYVAAALTSVKNFGARELSEILDRAAVELGPAGLVRRVLPALLQQIGVARQNDDLKVAHERVASAVIRNCLSNFAGARTPPENPPRLIVTTPCGQCHELGAILLMVTATNEGWRTIYLGPCLPAEEIAGVAIQSQARAVAMSLAEPADDSRLEAEVTRLRTLLPSAVCLLVGGRTAAAHDKWLQKIDVVRFDNPAALPSILERLSKARQVGTNDEG